MLNVVNYTREIFLTLNRTVMAACCFHLRDPSHPTSFMRIPLVRFTADQTGVKHTFLCLPPTFSSVCSSLDWLLTGSWCICPTFIPPPHLLPHHFCFLCSSSPPHLPVIFIFISSSHLSPFPFISTPHLIYFFPPSFILLSHSSDLLVLFSPPIRALKA